jgi:hypothetical protein
MIKKLLSLLRRTAPAGPPSVASTPSPNPSPSDSTPLARWLAKSNPDNPFVLDGFDCHQFVSSMLSTTKDPEVAASFSRLRSADGRTVQAQLPEDPFEIPCSLAYKISGEPTDGVLFKASVMEEKWDIYLYERRIYFCRSWTGMLALVADISTEENALHVSRVWASRPSPPALAIRQVDYLIKSHLYQQRVPHPLPADLKRESDSIALYSFSQYGRLCCFATYEDTLGKEVLKSSARSQPVG